MEIKGVFEIVIRHFGSQRNLARALCVTESAVSQWISAGKVPPLQAIKIESLMKCEKVKAADLIG